MYLVEVGLFYVHDFDIQAEFPEDYSSWVDGAPVFRHRTIDNLNRDQYEGIAQSRTVVTDGLMAPVRMFSYAPPPKYPPHRIARYNCDDTLVVTLSNYTPASDVLSVVASVEAVNPAEQELLPTQLQNAKPDDPMKNQVWNSLYDWLIGVTPVGSERDQVTVALDQWRIDNPEGTATELALWTRNYTS